MIPKKIVEASARAMMDSQLWPGAYDAPQTGEFHGKGLWYERARIALDTSGIEELIEALKECASDLECEVEARYQLTKDHPAMTRKYERDMEPVTRASAVLEKFGVML